MRIARVIGTVTLNRRLPEFKPGRLVIAEAMDGQALRGHCSTGATGDLSASISMNKSTGGLSASGTPRATPMPESLVVFDELGAGVGQIIGVSEGREASMPFHPDKIPVDAYAAAILDTVEMIPEN